MPTLTGRRDGHDDIYRQQAMNIVTCLSEIEKGRAVLLYDHESTRAVSYLLEDQAIQHLVGAFQHLFFELDQGALDAAKANPAQTPTNLLSPGDELAQKLAAHQTTGQKTIQTHAIGTSDISFKEVWQQIQKDPAFGLFVTFGVETDKHYPPGRKRDQAREEAFTTMCKWLLSTFRSGQPDLNALAQEARKILSASKRANLLNELQTTGIKKLGLLAMSIDQATGLLIKQFGQIQLKLSEARLNGASDKASAKLAIDKMKPLDRAVVFYGADHGTSGGNKNSLVDQLIEMATAKQHPPEFAQPEIIRLTERALAERTYKELWTLRDAQKLRPHMTVLDYDTGKKITAEAWLDSFATNYPGLTPPPVGPKP